MRIRHFLFFWVTLYVTHLVCLGANSRQDEQLGLRTEKIRESVSKKGVLEVLTVDSDQNGDYFLNYRVAVQGLNLGSNSFIASAGASVDIESSTLRTEMIRLNLGEKIQLIDGGSLEFKEGVAGVLIHRKFAKIDSDRSKMDPEVGLRAVGSTALRYQFLFDAGEEFSVLPVGSTANLILQNNGGRYLGEPIVSDNRVYLDVPYYHFIGGRREFSQEIPVTYRLTKKDSSIPQNVLLASAELGSLEAQRELFKLHELRKDDIRVSPSVWVLQKDDRKIPWSSYEKLLPRELAYSNIKRLLGDPTRLVVIPRTREASIAAYREYEKFENSANPSDWPFKEALDFAMFGLNMDGFRGDAYFWDHLGISLVKFESATHLSEELQFSFSYDYVHVAVGPPFFSGSIRVDGLELTQNFTLKDFEASPQFQNKKYLRGLGSDIFYEFSTSVPGMSCRVGFRSGSLHDVAILKKTEKTSGN